MTETVARARRYGYLVCQQTADGQQPAELIDEIAAEAHIAQQYGYDGVFFSEHHQRSDNFLPSPLILAAGLAREVPNIDLGITVAVLPLYNLMRLLEDVTCLDVISRGRVIFGVGLGYVQQDFDTYGMTKNDAIARYREALPVLAKAWAGPWEHRGEHHAGKVSEFRPAPVNTGGPPVWVSANTKLGTRLAATYGHAWVIGARVAIGDAAELAGHYQESCEDVAREPQVALIRDAWLADSVEQAYQDVGRWLLRSYDQRVRAGLLRPLDEEQMSGGPLRRFAAIARNRWLIGDQNDIAEQLAEWRERTGADYVVVRFRQPVGVTHDAVCEQIARFGQQVVRGKHNAMTTTA